MLGDDHRAGVDDRHGGPVVDHVDDHVALGAQRAVAAVALRVGDADPLAVVADAHPHHDLLADDEALGQHEVLHRAVGLEDAVAVEIPVPAGDAVGLEAGGGGVVAVGVEALAGVELHQATLGAAVALVAAARVGHGHGGVVDQADGDEHRLVVAILAARFVLDLEDRAELHLFAEADVGRIGEGRGGVAILGLEVEDDLFGIHLAVAVEILGRDVAFIVEVAVIVGVEAVGVVDEVPAVGPQRRGRIRRVGAVVAEGDHVAGAREPGLGVTHRDRRGVEDRRDEHLQGQAGGDGHPVLALVEQDPRGVIAPGTVGRLVVDEVARVLLVPVDGDAVDARLLHHIEGRIEGPHALGDQVHRVQVADVAAAGAEPAMLELIVEVVDDEADGLGHQWAIAALVVGEAQRREHRARSRVVEALPEVAVAARHGLGLAGAIDDALLDPIGHLDAHLLLGGEEEDDRPAVL